MQLKILGSSGSAELNSYTTSALIDGVISLDAGTGLHKLTRQELLNIKDLVITHAHIDHTVMLCFWADINIIHGNNVTIHCLQETADAIRHHLLNDIVWPDLEKINIKGKPFLTFNIVEPFQTIAIQEYRLTPLPVEHGIPAASYCIHGDNENFIFSSDMIDAPEQFWQYLQKLDNFHRMTLEISFADSMKELARSSYHLTPGMLKKLLAKIPPQVNILYNHTKTECTHIIAKEVGQLFSGRIEPIKDGDVLEI